MGVSKCVVTDASQKMQKTEKPQKLLRDFKKIVNYCFPLNLILTRQSRGSIRFCGQFCKTEFLNEKLQIQITLYFIARIFNVALKPVVNYLKNVQNVFVKEKE